ncbi:hypothetical protein EVAR_53264_1 [Eumeta japonica]|uniref:Uncharacterized protein n=1 Tax=Eumeta variegata TaxID=151549 RepID=A0A4C1YKQ9_EUMVA|nr:hypothetical protein EVAR_53264_1 [Eumeta japonica]
MLADDHVCQDFMQTTKQNSSVTIASLNMQSVNTHDLDVVLDHALKIALALAISETWLHDCGTVLIDEFHCVTRMKRDSANKRSCGGVEVVVYMNR